MSFSDVAIDWHELEGIFSRMAALFAEYHDLVGELPHGIQDSVAVPTIDREVLEAWFERKALPLGLRPADPDEGLVWEALIHATIKPFLVQHAEALREHVDQENWRRGYCPVCGGIPDFSFLDQQNGARQLVCSRCDTLWLFQRMQCPFCSNEDQNTLAYFTDDPNRYRLYVCDRCHRYLKAIDLRSAPAGTNPLVERLLTPDLDREAADKGYGSGWEDGQQNTETGGRSG